MEYGWYRTPRARNMPSQMHQSRSPSLTVVCCNYRVHLGPAPAIPRPAF